MTDANSNTQDAAERTDAAVSTDVVTVGEVSPPVPTGDALAQAITAESARIMGLPSDERDAVLRDAAMTRAGVIEGNVQVPTVTLLAAVRVRTALALDVERSASYQRALAYAHGERHLFLKRGEKNSTKPYTSASDFLIRGLGYPTDSMVTTLKQLSLAIEAGVEDGSPEWRHLVQSGKTRKMVADTLKSGKSPEAIESASKAIEARVAVNPSGRPADEPKATPDAPAANAGVPNGGPAHDADQPDPADAARVACESAVDTLRKHVGDLTRVAWVSVEDALTAILTGEVERRMEASKAEATAKRTSKRA